MVEDLPDVAVPILGCELDARPLAHSEAIVLPVLHVAELGRRRELLVVAVLDAGLRERRLETQRVRPRVLGTANPAPLPHVEHEADVRRAQCVEKGVDGEAVHTDRRDGRAGHSTYGQWRHLESQHVPRAVRYAAVNTKSPVAGSR